MEKDGGSSFFVSLYLPPLLGPHSEVIYSTNMTKREKDIVTGVEKKCNIYLAKVEMKCSCHSSKLTICMILFSLFFFNITRLVVQLCNLRCPPEFLISEIWGVR